MKAWGSKRIIRSEELQSSLEAMQLDGFTGLLSKHPAFREQAQKPTEPAPAATLAAEADPTPVPPPPIDYAAKLRAEMDAGRAQGHAEGYAAGHAEGHAAGFAEGQAAGEAAGREAGYAAGHEAGFAEGLAAGQAQGAADAAQLQSVMDDLTEQLAEFEERMAKPILDIALSVARQIVRNSLQADPAYVISVIREALDTLPDLYQQPRVQLHPDDLALVQQWMSSEVSGGGWRLEADATMVRGGCRLITGSAEADLTVTTRWRRVVETLGRQDDWQTEPLPAETIPDALLASPDFPDVIEPT